MLVCLAFCQKDKPQAVKLAEWIRDLGVAGSHDISLVRNDCDSSGVIEPLHGLFGTVGEYTPHENGRSFRRREGQDRINNWPQGPNAMWRCTAWNIFNGCKRHWLWLEPDAIPTRATWLDEIDAAYREAVTRRKIFLGARGASTTVECMNGVAVYPGQVFSFMEPMLLAQEVAWDLAGAAPMIQHGVISPLFQHVYRVKDRKPRFPEDMALLDPQAAIFHRDSEGTLIDVLRATLGRPMPAPRKGRAPLTVEQLAARRARQTAGLEKARAKLAVKRAKAKARAAAKEKAAA
jgi:hypothetical protein